jgi:hypothetical protein
MKDEQGRGPRKEPQASGVSVELDRGRVWKLLGPPTDQEGSVNDPRTREDFDVKWNEKWIYRAEDGRSVERVVLWHRYDLAGVFLLRPDGSAEPEAVPED